MRLRVLFTYLRPIPYDAMEWLTYILITLILLVAELIYLPIARQLRVGDRVTPRSSHKAYHITGGGFIFWFAAIIFTIVFKPHPPSAFNFMLIGATLLAVVSFTDDMIDLSPGLRLLVQTLVVAMTFHRFFFDGYYDIFFLTLICGVGFINAFNFMDGINGLMSIYSLVTLGTLLYSYSMLPAMPCAPKPFIITLIISVAVFAIFNFRKKAVCFAGDVGSIVMGFFITYLMVQLISYTADASYVVFLMVYAVDAVYTIFQRLFMGENILMPHRHHLYQVMANKWGKPHRSIAMAYAGIQLAINVIYFIVPETQKWTYAIILLAMLTAAYFILKRRH